jgi:coproporphyrinogen III oxidase-like Fe-S oxidoreductase
MLTETLITTQIERLTKRCLASTVAPVLPAAPDSSEPCLLYIHIPFCRQLCPYCSFFRVTFDRGLAIAYFEALKEEIRRYHREGYNFDAVYIGGGTPTVMPDALRDIVRLVRSLWSIGELSVETNPDDLEPSILEMLRSIGTNRLSVGVQSFDDDILKRVRRFDKYGSGLEIKQRLMDVVGLFQTVNVDMIFNFPNQTEQILAADIEILEEINPPQITWYPLMISRSRKADMTQKCGRFDVRREKRLYDFIYGRLMRRYRASSVWCFSNTAGLIDEYPVTHHNYAAAGASAMGYVGGNLYFNVFSIPSYIERIGRGETPLVAAQPFSTQQKRRFRLLMELLTGSLDISAVNTRYGKRFLWSLAPELCLLFVWGAISVAKGRISLTRKGRHHWLAMMRTIFSTLGDYRDMHICSADASVSAAQGETSVLVSTE